MACFFFGLGGRGGGLEGSSKVAGDDGDPTRVDEGLIGGGVTGCCNL